MGKWEAGVILSRLLLAVLTWEPMTFQLTPKVDESETAGWSVGK